MEYELEVYNEGYLVEDILQLAYIDEKLEYIESKLNKDYMNRLDIIEKKGSINLLPFFDLVRIILFFIL